MDAIAALERLGGVGTPAQIASLVSRSCLRTAVANGQVVKLHRGRYTLASVGASLKDAHAVSGVVSHLSAALWWGWPVKWLPEHTWVTVPRKRRSREHHSGRIRLVHAELADGDVIGGVTSPLRTVLDCARRLNLDEALCVADAALRSRSLSHADLIDAAWRARGPGSAGCRRVAESATGKAANPFESVLRAICSEFPALVLEPQGEVLARDRVWHPDLVERQRRLAIEADSWEFHTGKDAHAHAASATRR